MLVPYSQKKSIYIPTHISSICENWTSDLDSVDKNNELIIGEKIFIHKHTHHIMNFEVPPESSFIKRYVWRSPDST